MDPSISRTTWLALEPYHAMVYFAPDPQEEYAALGLGNQDNPAAGYFPARAAALGAVGPGLVQATFFNFSRLAVEFGMAGAWDQATPSQVLEARYRGADRALRRLCGDALDQAEVGRAVELARAACAGCTPYGRPLYAAHADLAWPDEPHVQLWHAVMLLREFRGDGHISALTTEGFTGLEAAITHVAQGDLWTKDGLRTTRGYTEEEWQAGVDGLVDRGLLTPDEQFTADGEALRQQVEHATDVLALPAWEQIGEDGCTELVDLVRPLVDALVANGGFPLTR